MLFTIPRLLNDLKAAWPDPDNPMCLATLEKLPYLTAVVKESLRLGHGVCTPLPRVVGPSNAIIGGFPIPAGAVVEMSSVFIHEDPKAFEDPLEFLPERWLRPETRDMERNFVPFAKGPRMCLGLKYVVAALGCIAHYVHHLIVLTVLHGVNYI